MPKKLPGHKHCSNKECPEYNKKIWIKTPKEMDELFEHKIPWPKCEKCGKSMGVWDRKTQENFDKVF